MVMNRENLRLMAAHLLTIPAEMFDMLNFRRGCKTTTAKCGSVGCAIGHCIILDTKPIPRHKKTGNIKFEEWSEEFTGLAFESPEWQFCFSVLWVTVDNTPQGASNRILTLLDSGLPANWEDQMYGVS